MALPVESHDALPDRISPEGARVASVYLETGCNIEQTAAELNLPAYEISQMLEERQVSTYVQHVISEAGLRQMDSISSKMDALIQKKLEELEDLEMTSGKDIADLLAMHHKMETEKYKLRQLAPKPGIGKQTNVQINSFDNSQYGKLMHQLMNGEGN